jgi:hypothetical protein
MLDAYTEINNLPREPYDNLERVVAPLMMWSDATHLRTLEMLHYGRSTCTLVTSQSTREGSRRQKRAIVLLIFLRCVLS